MEGGELLSNKTDSVHGPLVLKGQNQNVNRMCPSSGLARGEKIPVLYCSR